MGDDLFADRIAPELSPEALAGWGEEQRARGHKIVFTNGCFDLLHEGHVRSLFQASGLGDLLVVATNSDESVRRLKGAGRPVLDQRSRSLLLRSLRCVGAVTIFADLSVLPTIRRLRPDIIAKGAEYRPEEVVGFECIDEWGGRIERLPMVEGVGTTAILDRYRRAIEAGD